MRQSSKELIFEAIGAARKALDSYGETPMKGRFRVGRDETNIFSHTLSVRVSNGAESLHMTVDRRTHPFRSFFRRATGLDANVSSSFNFSRTDQTASMEHDGIVVFRADLSGDEPKLIEQRMMLPLGAATALRLVIDSAPMLAERARERGNDIF